MAKIGMNKKKEVGAYAGADLAKALIKIVAIGVAGGAALIAGGKTVGENLLNEEKIKKLKK